MPNDSGPISACFDDDPKLILIPGGWAGRKASILGVYTVQPYLKTHWKRWGAKLPNFSSGFCGRRDRLDTKIRRFPARPASGGDKDKCWSSRLFWESTGTNRNAASP